MCNFKSSTCSCQHISPCLVYLQNLNSVASNTQDLQISLTETLFPAAALSLIPDDNAALAALKYGTAAVLFGSSAFFVVGAFALSALNED